METAFAPLVGFMVAVAVWLMLAGDLLRFLFGLTLIGNAVNLAIFAAGRLTRGEPPLAAPGALAPPAEAANALPQALILTAIVIGFGLFAFALALTLAAARAFGSTRTDALPAPDALAEDAAPAGPGEGPRA
jgi:multicomponent Na+:H+ antiporter subunit C